MTDAILSIEHISYRYPDGTPALADCSLTIGRSSKTVVLGANGAGKTTLFLHLNGLLRPASGRLRIGTRPYAYHRAGLRELRSKIGLVFQNPDHQLFSASVREDVSFGPMNLGVPGPEVRRRVEQALQAVGMLEAAEKPVHNLSYGQKKRVCIAGVLAMQPEILVFDEPMAGLDSAMQRDLTALLDQLHASGLTIIIATHDLDFAYGWADTAVVMQQGRLLAHGASQDVLQLAEVQHELAAAPLVAEITCALALIGVDLRDKDNLPRSRNELVQAIRNFSFQETTP